MARVTLRDLLVRVCEELCGQAGLPTSPTLDDLRSGFVSEAQIQELIDTARLTQRQRFDERHLLRVALADSIGLSHEVRTGSYGTDKLVSKASQIHTRRKGSTYDAMFASDKIGDLVRGLRLLPNPSPHDHEAQSAVRAARETLLDAIEAQAKKAHTAAEDVLDFEGHEEEAP